MFEESLTAPDPRLAALRELLAEEPEISRDVEAAFTDPRRMPRDIDLGLAGPAWETFVARGLVPEVGPPRRFVQRHKRRCPECRGRGGPSRRESCRTRLARDAGRDPLEGTFEPLSQPIYPWAPELWWYPREAAWPPEPEADRLARDYYDELAAAGAVVPAGGVRGTFPSFVPRGRLADLPNPFVPLCELAARGVTLERLDADAITLARPA